MSQLPLEQPYWTPEMMAYPQQRSARAGIGKYFYSAIANYVGLTLILIAFIPMIKSDTMDTGLTPGRVIELFLLAVGCTTIGITSLVRPGWMVRMDRASLAVMVAFCGMAFISAVWSPLRVLTAAKSIEMLCITAAATMAGSWAAVYAPSRRQMATILALSLVSTIFFFLLVNVPINGTPIPMTADTGRSRLFFGTSHPLETADMIALAMIAVIASRLNGFFLKTPILLFLGGLFFLTQPRGAAGGFLCAITLMATFKIKRVDLRIAVFVLLFLLMASVAAALGPDLYKLYNKFSPDDADTLNGRTQLWQFAISQIAQKPILGWGYYASRFLLLDLFYWAGHCHNAYLEAAMSLGVFGIILIIALTVRVVKVALRTHDPLLLGVAGYCYSVSMLDPLLLTPSFPMVVLLVALMTAGATDKPVRRRAVPMTMPDDEEIWSDEGATGP